jgi:hypothetical protein
MKLLWRVSVLPASTAGPKTVALNGEVCAMNQDELTKWALVNGWQDVGGHIVLVRPTKPSEAIVRLVFKGTIVQLEIKKPSGKWEKVKSEAYAKIVYDEDAELPRGIGLTTISGLTALMRDNKDRLAFSKLGGTSKI